jgi:DNA-binding NarL/FixJ family response regulator
VIERKTGSVVLADEDAEERTRIAETLRRAGFEAIEVGSGFDALEFGRGAEVALVLLEVSLPGMTGYEVCHELRQERGSELGIVFLSATRSDPIDRVAGLLLGADDFLAKPIELAELVTRVGRFVRRAGAQAAEADGFTAPTPREREVLELLAQGLVQKEIARALSISPKTVGTHIQKLLLKTNLHSRAELVARAYRSGLVSPLHDRRNGEQQPHSLSPHIVEHVH